MNFSFSSVHYLTRLAIILVLGASYSSAATHDHHDYTAHQSHSARPDGHAPISVMGDHTHHQGEWMISYRTMHMAMDDNYSGSNKIGTAQVLASFMVSPISMSMDMHMVGVMHAPSDELTLMLMIPYLDISMDHITRMGARFTTKTSGLSDPTIGGLWTLNKTDTDQVHLNFGVSLPTGKIEARGATPMGANRLLPYAMRLGSGTFDFKPGITWNHRAASWSAGAQASGTIRLGKNDRGYRLGNTMQVTTWAARTVTPSFSVSARVSYDQWGDISGRDARLNPMMVPTARTDLRGGQRITTWIGANLIGTKGALTNHRLAVEVGAPVQRDLDGPQLSTSLITTLGWQYAF